MLIAGGMGETGDSVGRASELMAKIREAHGRGDGGRLYDPLVDELTRGGMAVFRSSDSAIRTLALYIEGRLYAEAARGVWKNSQLRGKGNVVKGKLYRNPDMLIS